MELALNFFQNSELEDVLLLEQIVQRNYKFNFCYRW